MRLSRALGAPIALAALVALGVALWLSIAERLLRAAEQRLGAETGLDWTIGAVDLGLGPELVLTEVAARTKGGGAPLLAAREARVFGDLATLRGDAGAWRATLAGAAVALPRPASPSAPLGALAAATASAQPIPRLAALTAKASGVELDDGDAKTLTIRAQTLDLSGRLAPGAATADLALELETPTHRAALGFSWPPGEGSAKLAVSPLSPQDRRVEAVGKLAFAASRLRLTEASGMVGDAPFSAEATLDLAAQPSLDASIRVSRMILTDDSPGSAMRAPAESRPGAHVVTTADLEKIDPRALEGLRLALAIAIEDLRIGRVRLGGVTTRTNAADRLVDVAIDAKSFYDGGLRGRYTLAPRGESALIHQLSLSIANARVARLIGDAGGPRALDGVATARVELQTAGASLAEALRAADGRAEITLADGRVADIGKTIDIPFASTLLGALDDGALTRFRKFGGSFAIKNGAAASHDLKFESKLVEASGAGRADLVKGVIDFTFDTRLSLAGRKIKTPIRVFGPWSDPSVDADLGNAIGGAIDAIGGADLGGVLDSLFSEGGGNGTLGRKRSGR
ncbi:MAG TPA: AsmA-like C-terminal region-containing protein [Methylosinus sp.]|jgi:uncharacterized protein involved in outer membrane biogenesis